MLYRLNMNHGCADTPMRDNRYDRNEMEDLKTAIGYLYDFSAQLKTLHPNVAHTIEQLIKNG